MNVSLVDNTTNPMCRASYLGFKNLINILLKHGADINIRSSEGRNGLMWAAFRNNIGVAELLLDNGIDIEAEDNAGWNALDIAIMKMNYDVALFLKKRGLIPRQKEMYENNLW